MSDDDQCGDNDADKRPRIFGKAQTRDATIQVAVTGAEGETTADLETTFEGALDRMAEEADVDAGETDGGAFQ